MPNEKQETSEGAPVVEPGPEAPSSPPSASLPRVGTPGGALPGQEEAASGVEEQGEQTSRWWVEPSRVGARPSSGTESSGRNRGWTTSAGEEMEKFRRLPVVGRLPWRVQYAIALSLLALSLVVLIILSALLAHQGDLVARAASADLAMRQTLQSVGSLRHNAQGASDSSRVAVILSQGNQAIEQLGGLEIPGQAGAIVDLKGQWTALSSAVSSQATMASSAQTVSLAAQDLHGQLGDLIPRMKAVSQQVAPSMGLTQVLADLTDWQESAAQISVHSSAIPERLLPERQRIEQLLRAFAAQPDHAQSQELGAWQVLAGAWPTLQPRLDAILVQREAWSSARGGAQVIGEKVDAISQTLNGLTATSMAWQANQGSLRSAAWLVGGIAALTLAFFMLIAWKQQRYRILEALSHQEQTEHALQAFVEDIREIASGNLTRRPRVSATSVGVVAETLGKAIDVLRKLIARVKRSVEKTSEASVRASAATVALVDGAQLGATTQREQLPFIQSMARQSHELATSLVGVSARTQASATAADAVVADAEGSREGIQVVRSALEEARTRADRLAAGASDHNRALGALGDLAEEAKVLSIQVSIQASKLGERGQGLQRVSDGISQMATRLEPLAQKTLAQARSLQADGEGVARHLDAAASVLVDGGRRAEAVALTAAALRAQVSALARELAELSERAETQDDGARQLDALARQASSRIALAPQEAEIAAVAVSELIQVAQDLGASVERFRV